MKWRSKSGLGVTPEAERAAIEELSKPIAWGAYRGASAWAELAMERRRGTVVYMTPEECEEYGRFCDEQLAPLREFIDPTVRLLGCYVIKVPAELIG